MDTVSYGDVWSQGSVRMAAPVREPHCVESVPEHFLIKEKRARGPQPGPELGCLGAPPL